MTDRDDRLDTGDELAIEALAHGRDDLLDELLDAGLLDAGRLDALRADEAERARVATARALSIDLGLVLRDATPAVDVDAMVARALQAVPPAPSGQSLRLAAALAALGTAALALLTLELPSARQVLDLGHWALAMVGAIDQVVSALPGGWTLVGGGLALGLIVLLAPAGRLARNALGALALVALTTGPGAEASAQRFTGDWSGDELRISVDAEQERTSVVVRRAADAAGLGVVLRLDDDPQVSLQVRDLPLRDVLRALLDEGHEVQREGRMLIVRRASEVAATPPTPAPPPAVDRSAVDRSAAPVQPTRRAFGGDVVVARDERVQSVSAFGGDVRIEGEVVDSVVSWGGDVDVREGGVVGGDVVATGGDLFVRPGGTVRGRTVMTGGSVHIDDGADVQTPPIAPPRVEVRVIRDSTLQKVASAAIKHGLLFLLGLLLLGAFRERHANLARAMVERPMRSGLLGLLGLIGAPILMIVLLITLIGIPGALLIGLVTFVGVYAGIAVSASVLGAVLPIPALKERPIAQLGVGVTVLFLVSLVPVIGGLIGFLLAALGLGAVIATRFGGREPAPPVD